jgi:hypothetical protein
MSALASATSASVSGTVSPSLFFAGWSRAHDPELVDDLRHDAELMLVGAQPFERLPGQGVVTVT